MGQIKLLSLVIVGLMAACTPTQVNWQANYHVDEFTDTKMCRVEHGDEYGRSFLRSFAGQYFSYNFYAENNEGEIRAGVRTEPQIPISGDVQIKVNGKLYTLKSTDTPIDVAPVIPANTEAAQEAFGKAYAETMKSMTKNIQQMNSPYRAFTGKKAK